CYLAGCDIQDSVIGVRMAVREGTTILRSVLLGARFYEYDEPPTGRPALGIGKDVMLEHVIVDKNARIGDGARLRNERHLEHEGGDGYDISRPTGLVPSE